MKKLKRRDHTIRKQLKEVSEGKEAICSLQQKATLSESHVPSLKAKIDRLRHRSAYWKSKSKDLNRMSGKELAEAMFTAESKQIQLREEVAELKCENLELRDTVQEVMSEASSNVLTFEKGKYSNDIRACCYELLALNVGVRNVKAVIESVLTCYELLALNVGVRNVKAVIESVN